MVFKLAMASVLPFAALALAGKAFGQTDALDQIVVVVNGEAVTETAIQRNIRILQHDARQNNSAVPTGDAARRIATENAINFSLQRQFASSNGILVPASEVEQRIAELSAQAQLDPEAFLEQFETVGLSRNDVYATIGQNLLAERIVQRVIIPRVRISEAEIERFRQANRDQFMTSVEEFDLELIVVSTPLGADAEYLQLLRQSIVEIRRELRAGRDFFTVANAYAQYDGIDTGAIGWVSREAIQPAVINAIASAEDNQFVGPILIGSDTIYAISKGRRTRGTGLSLPTLLEYSLARIVLHATTEAGAAALIEELNEIRTNITQGGDFGALAKLHSQDIETKQKGGDMGWVPEDNLAFEYRQLLAEMQVGEVSTVQQIGFSVFILQFRDVREAGTTERIHAAIRDILRENKVRIEQTKWLDGLRADATIVYRRIF